MNLNFNFDGKTLLRYWWTIIRDNLQTIQRRFTDHRTASELDHPDKSVKQRHIADNAIGSAQLAPNSVMSDKIYPAAVQTTHIKDGIVTKEKLEKDLRDLLDELQNYSPTYNLTFSNFDLADAEYPVGIKSDMEKIVDNDFVFWKSKSNCMTSDGGAYSLLYFGGIGSVSNAADANKPIKRLEIRMKLIVENGGLYDTQGELKLYRLTENMSPIDRDFGKEIPQSAYQVVHRVGGYTTDQRLEIVFLEPITLKELGVAAETSATWSMPDEDENAEYKTMYAYPCVGFKAEVEQTGITVDTDLSDTSVNPVENRVITAGIKAARAAAVTAAQEAVQEVKDDLYGSPIHTYKIVLPKTAPLTLENMGADDFRLHFDFEAIELYVDGVRISDLTGNLSRDWVEASLGEGAYINLYYDTEFETPAVKRSEEKLPSTADTGSFEISLYHFYLDADKRLTVDFVADNASTAEDTYTVALEYTTPVRGIENLQGYDNFLDAANKHTDDIVTLKNEISGIDLAILSLQALLGTLANELDAVNGAAEG